MPGQTATSHGSRRVILSATTGSLSVGGPPRAPPRGAPPVQCPGAGRADRLPHSTPESGRMTDADGGLTLADGPSTQTAVAGRVEDFRARWAGAPDPPPLADFLPPGPAG